MKYKCILRGAFNTGLVWITTKASPRVNVKYLTPTAHPKNQTVPTV